MRADGKLDPALYAKFPTKGPRPKDELEKLEAVWCKPSGWEWLSAINNNFVGVYYIGAAMLFFVLAGALALLMRTQLALPLNGFLSQEAYNQIFTVHGTAMMFLFAVPAVEALGVLLLPQMLGARDLPFPRLSAYAFWAYLIGGLAFFCSLFFSLAPDGGWFMYPPLTSTAYSPGINADFWLVGIGFIEISAIAGAIEIIVGVLRTRSPGMSLDKLPVFAWAMLVFAVMIIIAFPAVILATTLMELERALGWPFFDATKGGDPLLWQHLFWFFGHPEVYIIFLPAAGAMSTMVAAVSRTPLIAHTLVVLSMIATGFISFGVWAHHMFTTGMPEAATGFFSAASMLVSIPAGVQVFAWIATIASGKPRFSTPGLFVFGGLSIFVFGGLTGVMAAFVPFDWQVHDTYFIVAHLHYVLIGGMVLPFFGAIYFWTPMVSARALSERLGRWVFWLMFVGVHVAFLPMHLTGMMGMPRRVYTYLPGRGWELPNLISTVGAFMIGAATLIWIVDMARNFRPFGDRNAGNVHDGPGLEWLPSGLYASRSIPIVTSLYPLWEQKGLARDVEAGRYFLPGTATGLRETILTSTLTAQPQALLIMPKPSGWPIWAAAFTAGFFLLLTIQAYGACVVSGVLAVYCVLNWCWQLDKPPPQKTADIGAGIRAPTYVNGPQGHGWWAMAITLIVAGMVWGMGIFSHLFLWSRNPADWTSAPQGLPTAWVVTGYALSALLAVTAPLILRRGVGRAAAWSSLSIVAAAGLLTTAWWTDYSGWTAIGLDPRVSGQAAMTGFFLSWQGFFAAIAAVMGLYVLARWAKGLIAPERRATVQLVAMFLTYAAVQGAISSLLVGLAP